MAKCYVTGKGTTFGNTRSHALNATRRTWKVNLQTVRIIDEDGNVKKLRFLHVHLRRVHLQELKKIRPIAFFLIF